MSCTFRQKWMVRICFPGCKIKKKKKAKAAWTRTKSVGNLIYSKFPLKLSDREQVAKGRIPVQHGTGLTGWKMSFWFLSQPSWAQISWFHWGPNNAGHHPDPAPFVAGGYRDLDLFMLWLCEVKPQISSQQLLRGRRGDLGSVLVRRGINLCRNTVLLAWTSKVSIGQKKVKKWVDHKSLF